MRIATARNVLHTITSLLIGATDVKMEKRKEEELQAVLKSNVLHVYDANKLLSHLSIN